mmetsp:Transcript_2432/g.4384  ORF Transcript_2432/g.4384 Transcript_2432/m.4384 type:complete len:257 (+) Transcript_2432:2752-3522(+)
MVASAKLTRSSVKISEKYFATSLDSIPDSDATEPSMPKSWTLSPDNIPSNTRSEPPSFTSASSSISTLALKANLEFSCILTSVSFHSNSLVVFTSMLPLLISSHFNPKGCDQREVVLPCKSTSYVLVLFLCESTLSTSCSIAFPLTSKLRRCPSPKRIVNNSPTLMEEIANDAGSSMASSILALSILMPELSSPSLSDFRSIARSNGCASLRTFGTTISLSKTNFSVFPSTNIFHKYTKFPPSPASSVNSTRCPST